MYKTQDQETALLREELSKLLTTLKHNREKVSLDVLKTKYKKGYDTLCVSIKRSASDYAKRTALCGIRIHEDYLDEAAAVINGTIERCGILKLLSKAAFSHQDILLRRLNIAVSYLPKPPSAALSSIAVALATAQSSALHMKICSS